MNDNIHKTHFPVTKEMPWRKKEKLAILLLQKLLIVRRNHIDCYTECSLIDDEEELIDENKDLIDWVMKYND